MKVLLPVKNNELQKKEIADSFHSTQFVCIYDSEGQNYNWINTDDFSNTPGGLSAALNEQKVNSIVSPHITPMVLNIFKNNGIEVWKAKGNDLDENISLFKLKLLKMYSVEESRSVQACDSNSCSSCSSSSCKN